MSKAKSEPVAESLDKLLTGRVKELRRLLPQAVKAKDTETVHDARVATRRLKAAVDLAAPVLSAKPLRKFSRALRRLRRTLGPLRDADVMLTHLRELRGEHVRHRAAVDWLTKRVKAHRAKLARKCCRKMSPRARLSGLRSWKTLRRELGAGEQTVRRRATHAVPVQLAAFRDCADQLSSSRRERAAGGPGADVHELRIAAKLLRYTLELAAPLGYSLSGDVLRSFKQLQEALGLWHDYVVLGEQALQSATEDELSLHQPQLHGGVLELAHELWKRSEHELDRFSRLWVRHGEQLATEILARFRPRIHAPRRVLPHPRARTNGSAATLDDGDAVATSEPS